MAYQALDESSVIDYLLGIEEIRNYFGGDDLEAEEIGDGNLNYVYIIRSVPHPEKSLIVKQAVPYLRCVGEEYPLSKERMTYEIRSLQRYNDLAGEHVPTVHYADEGMSLVAMDHLKDHIIMRKGMMAGVRYFKFAEHISTFLAETLFKTSSLSLSSDEKRKMIDEFNANTELCKLTEDFVFTFPYMAHDTNQILPEMMEEARRLWGDFEFKEKVLELKYLFMNRTDALLHGDLHTGSIMLNQEQTYVIDSEFAFFGPFGFDVGALLANLAMSYISHFERSEDGAYRQWVLDTTEAFLTLFLQKFRELWETQAPEENALLHPGYLPEEEEARFRERFLRNLLRESVGFAGCKMARRQLGIAGVEDIRGIEDLDARVRSEKRALALAKRFVKEYDKIESVADVMQMIGEVE